MRERLVIIDGKSVFYRGYYAMPNLSTRDGTPTGGVYGFAVMALEVIKRLKPDYVCVAWDKSKTNIRKRQEMYPAYKANRKPPPADFFEQIPILRNLLDALNWPLYEIDDYEADDIMGAFAQQAKEKGIESFLITSDLDVLQLVNSHTHIYTLKKGLSNIEVFDIAHFEEKYGVGPHQWVDVKALKGDSSDNVPGVAGIGEKTALQLIGQYGTLDDVYANLEDLKPAVRAKLEANREMAYLSKELVTLMVDAPIKIDLAHAKLHQDIRPEFIAMLRKLEFRNLLRQAEAQIPKGEVRQAELGLSHQGVEAAKTQAFDPTILIPGAPRVIALNPEATELWVSADANTVSVMTLIDDGDPQLHDLLVETVAVVADGPVIGHDLKSVFRALLALQLPWQGEVAHDTRIGAFVLNSLLRSRELADIVQCTLDTTNPGEVVAAIWKAYEEQKSQFASLPDLEKLVRTIEFPMIQLLAVMEHRGVLLDTSYLADMSVKFTEQIKSLEQEIYGHASQEFNIASPAQLGTVLFEKLQLPTQGVKKGKTGYSTGAKELDKLRGLHPMVDLITKYRELTKLKSTYIDALPKQVDTHSRLHTTYALDVAATGRLSSHDPNLQNIPTRTQLGQAIRVAFVPAPGNVFVSADYSQFELRLAAVMADDKKLINDFNQGLDIHLATAAEVYGVPLDQVTKDMRRNAKTINFGVLYGMSPHGLSVATGMSIMEAKEFIDRYFALRAPIRSYMDATVEKARQEGYVSTLFGRRRPTPDLNSSNFVVREAAKRAAINMPIQGTEADLMKMAMLAVEQKLQQNNWGEQILQVHDSIIVECPKENAAMVKKLLVETMEGIYKLPVRLQADATVGGNWGVI